MDGESLKGAGGGKRNPSRSMSGSTASTSSVKAQNLASASSSPMATAAITSPMSSSSASSTGGRDRGRRSLSALPSERPPRPAMPDPSAYDQYASHGSVQAGHLQLPGAVQGQGLTDPSSMLLPPHTGAVSSAASSHIGPRVISASPQQSSSRVPAPSATYPGRAASLPGGAGSVNPTRSRSSQGGLPSTSGPQLSNGMYHANAASTPSGTFAVQSGSAPSGYPRDTSQLRAQVAYQQAATGVGSLPTNFYGQNQHHHQQPSGITFERYAAELTNCIVAFLSPILPTEEEYRIKEATRRQLERLAGNVSPGAKLLAFGSMANGFALRNSDMDLCCLIGDKNESTPSASELVELLSDVIRKETDFKVQPLPKARIPIIKISRASTTELPYEIACDIGFENRLALENTRLLLSYAMVDPPRLRTLVLFLKVWTKRRKLNSPYMGTLSSYGYTLLVLYFLCHVKRPAVLPHLQRIPPTRTLTAEEIDLNGNNIYFYDDMATLRKEWTSENRENVAELLIDFFRYFAKEFVYARDVISLKTETGVIPKDGITWNAELCIEDPFQAGYNVSRTVTKDGLYTIRGEFIRANRILQNRHNQRVSAQLAELCEEREDIVARAPDTPPARYHKFVPGMYGGPTVVRDVYGGYHHQPRRGTANVQPSGFGGSFAFEEMARGLGRQRGQMAYPTAAMLAPLSQNGGLSPKVTPRGLKDPSGRNVFLGNGSSAGNVQGALINSASPLGTSTTPRHASTVPSSARSDDGESSASSSTAAAEDDPTVGAAGTRRSRVESQPSQQLGPHDRRSHQRKRMVNSSARTSPTYAPAVPHMGSRGGDDDGVLGEAWAFGSEIVFGSEKFRVHPQPASSRRSTQTFNGERLTPRKTSAATVDGTQQRQQQQQQQQHQQAGTSGRDGSHDGVTNARSQLDASEAAAAAPPSTNRASRSLSDGVNRSKSLPRGYGRGLPGRPQGGEANDSLHREFDRMHVTATAATAAGRGAGLRSPTASTRTDADTSLLGGSAYPFSSSASSSAGGASWSSTADDSNAMQQEYTAAWAQSQRSQQQQQQQQHRHDGSLFKGHVTSQAGVMSDGEGGDTPQDHQRDDNDGADDDGDSELSEGVLDELSRISQMEEEEQERGGGGADRSAGSSDDEGRGGSRRRRP